MRLGQFSIMQRRSLNCDSCTETTALHDLHLISISPSTNTPLKSSLWQLRHRYSAGQIVIPCLLIIDPAANRSTRSFAVLLMLMHSHRLAHRRVDVSILSHMKLNLEQLLWGVLRLSLGWIFLWAFADKVWGLGFSTEPGKGWIDGTSPTFGYLKFATHGPLAGVFQALAGNALVDWLFMVGLLLIGIALMLGIGLRVAGYSGALMMFLLLLATSLPPEHNPLIDEHAVYLVVLLLITQKVSVGSYLGLGAWWEQLKMVKHYPWLR